MLAACLSARLVDCFRFDTLYSTSNNPSCVPSCVPCEEQQERRELSEAAVIDRKLAKQVLNVCAHTYVSLQAWHQHPRASLAALRVHHHHVAEQVSCKFDPFLRRRIPLLLSMYQPRLVQALDAAGGIRKPDPNNTSASTPLTRDDAQRHMVQPSFPPSLSPSLAPSLPPIAPRSLPPSLKRRAVSGRCTTSLFSVRTKCSSSVGRHVPVFMCHHCPSNGPPLITTCLATHVASSGL